MDEKIMFVRLSLNCNAGCFMCYFAHNHGFYNISENQFDEVLQYMKKVGTYDRIRFTGGEPLIHPEVLSFIKKSHDAGFVTSIITNGYLLPNLADGLVDSGIDQIIISIDGSKSDVHDTLRGLPNGLSRIQEGVKKIREKNPKVVFRANTVVSPFNIDDLNSIYQMLDSYHFDSWSIIPIRPTDDVRTLWNPDDMNHYLEKYQEFLLEQRKHSYPRLLGYSNQWAGSNMEELENTFQNKFRVVPTNKCNLVDSIRFYIPDLDIVVPCNCAAHRIHQIEADYNSFDNKYEKANIMADWLKENGPSHCSGCEPLNAYVADHPKVLVNSLFDY